MRGFGVLLSPDSPGSDAVKIRTEPGNPRGKKNISITIYSYSQVIASGKPTASVWDLDRALHRSL